MVAVRFRNGLMEHGIHLATCRKASTASDDLMIMRLGRHDQAHDQKFPYLSSFSPSMRILSTTEVTMSAAEDGIVVRRKELIDAFLKLH
jgi:hypothetical protein